jgi:Zn finger protein HypA/HybF involved in hydrogenase expression
MADLLAAYRHTTKNRAEIEASTTCGCCYCMQTFPADEIVAWAGLDFSQLDNPDAADAETAVCPRCGSEAVMGDKSGFPINPPFLGQMNEAWFQRTIVRKPAPKK